MIFYNVNISPAAQNSGLVPGDGGGLPQGHFPVGHDRARREIRIGVLDEAVHRTIKRNLPAGHDHCEESNERTAVVADEVQHLGSPDVQELDVTGNHTEGSIDAEVHRLCASFAEILLDAKDEGIVLLA